MKRQAMLDIPSSEPSLPAPIPAEPAPRRHTCTVTVGAGKGAVTLGGGGPLVVQALTNTDTADVASTVSQVAALARAGSELVRVTVDREDRKSVV
jgi:(E)-4-hydroxy-3-methylbut-2-enyl-diphosphate synthase